MNGTGRDPLPGRIEFISGIVLAVLLAASLPLGSSRFSLGILSGGLLSIVNFHGLYRSLLVVLSRERPRGRTALLLRYYLRLVPTALVLYWLVSGNRVDVIGLLVGLSLSVITIVLTTLLGLSGKKSIEEA